MLRYVLKRLLHAIPIAIGITFVSFCLVSLSPSDPAEVAVRVNEIVPTPEVLAETRAQLGLDRPFLARYGSWLMNAASGDFGTRWSDGRPVAEAIAEALPPTLELAAAALLLILAASLAIGILCARHEGGLIDRALRLTLFTSGSVPSFLSGLLLIWLFSVKLGWLPTSGMQEPGSVILPAMALAPAYAGTGARLIRASLIEARSQPWTMYLRACGLPEAAITRRMLKNALQSCLIALGMSIPKLIAGAFAVECVFAWPGIGRLAVTAIFNRDYPMIEAYVLLMGLLFLAFNLAADIAAAWINPKLKEAA